MRHLHVHVTLVHKFDVEDQIGLCRNAWIGGARSGASAHTIRKLPGNEQASLAANVHARKTLVESGDQTTRSPAENSAAARSPILGFPSASSSGLPSLSRTGVLWS